MFSLLPERNIHFPTLKCKNIDWEIKTSIFTVHIGGRIVINSDTLILFYNIPNSSANLKMSLSRDCSDECILARRVTKNKPEFLTSEEEDTWAHLLVATDMDTVSALSSWFLSHVTLASDSH